jgi:hypothetical protein
MSDHEPGDTMVDALRRANPVPVEPGVSRRAMPSAHALYADIVSQRPRRVRRRVLVIALVVILLGLILMAFAVVRRGGSSLAQAPECFASDSLHARAVVAVGDDPVHACAELWTRGAFGRGAAPDFDVCVLRSGVLGVFPGESGSVCGRLDLPESSGGDNSVARFSDAISRKVEGECIGFARAEQIIRSELRDRKLSGWVVKRGVGGFDSARPCATTAVDGATRTVVVIATANPFVVPPSTVPERAQQ